MKRSYLIVLIIFNSALLNAQKKQVLLSLELIADSATHWFDPILILYEDKTVHSFCPCFAYHSMDGDWKNIGDTAYYIKVTEKSSSYYYKTVVQDSIPIDKGTALKFITPTGKSVKNILVKKTNDSIEYNGNEKGIVYFKDTAISYRLLIKAKKYKNEFLRASRHHFLPGKQYTIILPEPVNSQTEYFYLRKEADVWVMFDKNYNNKIAYFKAPE